MNACSEKAVCVHHDSGLTFALPETGFTCGDNVPVTIPSEMIGVAYCEADAKEKGLIW